MTQRSWIWVWVIILALLIPHIVIGADTTTIVVNAVLEKKNNAPEMPLIEPQSVIQKEILVFSSSAIDKDGDPLTFGAEPLPEGAKFDPITRTFSWIPTCYQSGTYYVTFSVTDGVFLVYQEVPIQVIDINCPPEIFITNQAPVGKAKESITFSISVTDPDNDQVFIVPHNLPAGATFTESRPGVFEFTWVPGANEQGLFTVTFDIGDNEHATTLSIPITVNPLTVVDKPSSGSHSAPFIAPIYDAKTGQLHHSFIELSGNMARLRMGLASQSGVTYLGTTTEGNTNYATFVDSSGNSWILRLEMASELVGGDLEGILSDVVVITAPAKGQTKIGTTTAHFRFNLGNCAILSKIRTEILESFSPHEEKLMLDAVQEVGFIPIGVHGGVKLTIEPPCSTGNGTLFLTMPCETVEGLGGAENILIVHLDDDGNVVEVVHLMEVAGADPEGNCKYEVEVSHNSIYGMVAVKAKETAGVTTAPNPDVAPMLVPGGVGFEAYLTQNPVLIVGVVAFLILLVFLESRFHILRRKEYKPLEGPEGGPPVIEGLIETDRQKALSGIIDVLNDVDGQIRDLETTLAKRAPGFVVAPAEADAIVEKFFYGCQVAEERIKTAAAADHISKRQVEHLNGQLKDAVDRMVQTSQKSAVLAQAVQARLGTGAASAGGET